MRVDPYEVFDEIGRGGAGAVLRARAPDGTLVAIKVLLKSEPLALERFRREQRLQASLAVDGFVPVLGAGVSPSGPYLVMPFLGGGTLRGKLERGPLEIEEAVVLLREVSTAMGRAHARGIVHRDLKPENILFTDRGRPLIADLGIAKHFRYDVEGGTQSVKVKLSRTGGLLGTALYMAPEQIENAGTVSPRADVFALGAILYECLAGRPAFVGESVLELITEKLQDSARPSLKAVRSDAPARLRAVVERALARDPAKRFSDGMELARALEIPAEETVTRRSGRGTWILIAVSFVAVALAIALAVVLSWRPGASSDGVSTRKPIAIAVEVDEPKPLARFVEDDRITVRGRVTGPAERVLVNGTTAALADGGFEASIKLVAGADAIEVVALGADGARAESRRPVAVVRVPDWFKTIPKAERPPVPLPDGLEFGPGIKEYTSRKDGSALVFVPAGISPMGGDDLRESERPKHNVELDAYFIGKYEITMEEFAQFSKATQYVTLAEKREATSVWPDPGVAEPISATCKDPTGRGIAVPGKGYPAVQLTWCDAHAYCEWAGLRLPTEAEWEKAAAWDARARVARRFAWGDEELGPTSPRRANVADESLARTARASTLWELFRGHNDGYAGLAPTGAFPDGASYYGAVDMTGNVWEWCEDAFDELFYAKPASRRNPLCRGDEGSPRVLRGGSFRNGPPTSRAQGRASGDRSGRSIDVGFRVARSLLRGGS